jgi:hypothetical protein
MYFLIELNKENNAWNKSIYQYQTKKNAISILHTRFGNIMSNPNYTDGTVLLIDEEGNSLIRESYNVNEQYNVDDSIQTISGSDEELKEG